jgi:hypothetical protein
MKSAQQHSRQKNVSIRGTSFKDTSSVFSSQEMPGMTAENEFEDATRNESKAGARPRTPLTNPAGKDPRSFEKRIKQDKTSLEKRTTGKRSKTKKRA